jgi:hypothetical protein
VVKRGVAGRGGASTSCDITQHVDLPCRGRSNSEPLETGDRDIGNITYCSDEYKSNRMHGVSECSQPTAVGTVGGVPERARIATPTSAGRVQGWLAPLTDPVLWLAHPEPMRAAPLGASAAAEVGPDGRDDGHGGVRAAASKMGDAGETVRKCIELPVIDLDAG